MTLREYKKRLKKHDWYYAMSEDPKFYDSGIAEEKELKELAKTKKTFKQAYEEVKKKMLSDGTNSGIVPR